MDAKEAKELEPKLIKFYHDIIEGEILLNPDSLTRNSVRKLRKAYSKKKIQNGPSIISFASASTRCAYIYQFSPCFASATAFHFSQMLHKNPSLLAKIILQDTFTVCCLGGGPAAEIVAISMILEKVLQKPDHRRQKPLIINAIITDNDAGWISTAKNVIDNLLHAVDQSTIQLTFQFIECDLLNPLTEDVKDAIRKSDVVTIVKVLSVVVGPENESGGSRIIQETIECIHDGGMLFLLDSSGFKFLDVYDRLINSFESMDEIYGTLKNFYRLLRQSRKCLTKFSRSHKTPPRTIFSYNKIGVWCKKSVVPLDDNL